MIKATTMENYFTYPSVSNALTDYTYEAVTGRITERDDFELDNNISTLSSFIELEENWNDYGAIKFDKTYISSAINLLNRIKPQPEIFPSANGRILCEYDKPNGEHLSFDYFSDKKINVLIEKNGRTIMKRVNDKRLINIINKFYGAKIER